MIPSVSIPINRRMAELGASHETYIYALEWLHRLKEVVLSHQWSLYRDILIELIC